MKQNDIKHGHIYLVEEDVYIAKQLENGKEGIRTMIIPKGELLEFRYFSPAHFRDVYNNYFPIDDRQLNKLKPVAKIWEKVVFNNIAELRDILRLCLYDQLEKTNKRVVNVAFIDRANALKKHFDEKEVYTRL